jgi:tetratricopeptide (TPR) repeat protein
MCNDTYSPSIIPRLRPLLNNQRQMQIWHIAKNSESISHKSQPSFDLFSNLVYLKRTSCYCFWKNEILFEVNLLLTKMPNNIVTPIMKVMKSKPHRHTSHILEEQSNRYFRNALPIGWIVDVPTDYGIDYNIGIVSNEEVTGMNFSVQLKAKREDKNSEFVTITLKRSTVNLFSTRLEPVLLVCYLVKENEAYWEWFTDNLIDLTKNQKSCSIKISKANRVSNLNWNLVENNVAKIFNRKYLLSDNTFQRFSDNPNSAKLAWKLLYSKNYEEAVQNFQNALNKTQNESLLSGLSICQFYLFRYNEALITINKAIDLSKDLNLLAIKASILAEQGTENLDRGKLLAARELFEKVLRKNSVADLRYNYANTLSSLGDYNLAIEQYKICLNQKPNYAEAWKNLGQAYYSLHEHEKELECYNNALAINPALPQALFSKGVTLAQVYNEYRIALGLMNRAVQVYPNLLHEFPNSYYMLAITNMKAGNERKSLDYIERGLNFSPGDLNLLSLKGRFLSEQWRNSKKMKIEAINFFTYTNELFSNDYFSKQQLARINLHDGNTAAAFEIFREFFLFGIDVTLEQLLTFRIQLAYYLEAFQYQDKYSEFRRDASIERYFNQIQSELRLSSTFKTLLNITFATVFSTALRYTIKHSKDSKFEQRLRVLLCKLMKTLIPKLAPMLVSADVKNIQEFVDELSKIMVFLPRVAIVEIATIMGQFEGRFGLNHLRMNKQLDEISEKTFIFQLTVACMKEVNKMYPFTKKPRSLWKG